MMLSEDSKAPGPHIGTTEFAVLALGALGADARIGEHELGTDALHVELSLEIANQDLLLTGKVNPMRECLEKILHVHLTTG